MKYKGEDAPAKSGIAGVKYRERGKNKGKYQAFYQNPQGLVFTGEYRDTKEQALFDLTVIKARIYV